MSARSRIRDRRDAPAQFRGRAAALALAAILALAAGSVRAQPVLDENCRASILNRISEVNANGTYRIDNIPVPVGATRVRVVCEQNGVTYRGQSAFKRLIPNTYTSFGPISFADDDPIPVALSMTSPVALLTPQANGVQLVTTGTLVDGTMADFTLAETGTSYLSSNPAIASVTQNGFVLAVSSGNVLITATNEGVIATRMLEVRLRTDADGDQIPDDFEADNATNPGGANLARLPGVTVAASSAFAGKPASRVIDGSLLTSWFTQVGDAANLRTTPFIEVTLPSDISLAQIRVTGNRESPNGFDFLAGLFYAYDAAGNVVFVSPELPLAGPTRDLAVPVDQGGIRRVRFAATQDEGSQAGLSEFQLISRPGGDGLDAADPADAALDFDLDGLTNLQEYQRGTSLFSLDTDGDGVGDAEEGPLGTNPLLSDTDGDLLLDGDEIAPGADTDNDTIKNALDPDSDGDGLPDGNEVQMGTSPISADSNNNGIPDGSEDFDGDGLPNYEEVQEHSNPLDADTDDDGILDGEEVLAGDDGFVTQLLRADTDRDGMKDGFETRYGLDPTNPNDAAGDPDGDGLSNVEESSIGSDPFDPDVTPPEIAEVQPANAATGFATNGNVVVRFTEPLQVGSAGATSILIYRESESSKPQPADAVAPQSVTLSSDRLSVTFDPALDLDAFRTYRVFIQNVRDDAGNPFLGFVETRFTTGAFVDTVAPNVLRTNPVTNATSVPTNAPFTIEFSEPMDPATLTPSTFQVYDYTTGQVVAGIVQVEANGRFASFVPLTPYGVSRGHSVTLTTGIKDRAGNALSYRSYYFTTGFESDVVRPRLVQTSPPDGAVGVPVNALVSLGFDEPLSSLGLADGVLVSAGGVPIAGGVALSDGNRRVTFTSAVALPANTDIDVTLTTDVTDLAGLPLDNAGSFRFRTGQTPDLVAPSVASHNPVNGATAVPVNTRLTLRFSEAINPISVNATTFTVYDSTNGHYLTGAITVAPNRLSAIFTPSELLPPFAYFTWYLNGAIDPAGQAVPYTARSFTTSGATDGDAPDVETINPPDAATGVPVNASITVVFDEALDVLSIGAGSLQVFDGAVPVPGSVALDATLRRITFTPAAPLFAETPYEFDVSGVTDVAGNAVVPFSSGFTTAGLPGGNLSRSFDTGESASSVYSPSYPATNGADGRLDTFWCTANGQSANQGQSPYWEQTYPGDVRVDEIRFFGRNPGYNFLAGRFELFNAAGAEIYDSGQVAFALPNRDAVVATGGVTGVRRLRFTSEIDESVDPCFAEIQALGSYADPRLGRFLDTAVPTLTTTVPANAATGVALATPITLTFSEPMSPVSVNSGSIQVTVDGFSGVLPGVFSVNGPVVTFTPSSPLPPGRVVRIYLYASLEDWAGNDFGYTSFAFTTGAFGDSTPPAVVSVTPVNTATGVGRTAPIVLFFSEPLDANTVNDDSVALFANGAELYKSIARSADNTAITLTTTLPANAQIAVVATGDIRDLAGNRLADFQSTFTTGSVLDVGAPSVVTIRPGNGATRVPANSTIVLYASEALDPNSIDAGLFVAENGVLVPGALDLGAGGTTIEFTPDAPFAANALIQVFATPQILDTEGNPLTNYQASFRVLPNPAIESAFIETSNPVNGATGVPTNTTIDVRFSEPLKASTVNPATVRLYPSGLPEAGGAISLVDGGRVIRFVPTAALATSRSYSLQISGVQSADNGVLSFFSTGFTTGTASDSTAPVVQAISPPDDAVDVGVNAVIRVRFNEAVSPLTVGANTIALSGPDGALLAASIRFEDGNRIVVIDPQGPLAEGALHDVVVSGVRDVAGNLAAAAAVSFTTHVGPDTRAPVVSRASPASGVIDVPTNAVLIAEFDEPIDPGSIATASISVTPYYLTALPLAISAGADGRSLIIVPTGLAVNQGHTWTMSGIRDVTGNDMSYFSIAFTTGVQADTTGPQVLRVSPASGLGAIPTNVRLSIEFNEPVSNTALEGITLSRGGAPIAATVALSSGNRVATVAPLLPLAASALHTLRVASVEDIGGNAMAAAFQSTFTTGAGADLIATTPGASNPVQGATGVGTNTAIRVIFPERVNPVTVNTATFTLYDNLLGIYRSGSVSVPPDGLSATFTPDAPLTPYASHSWYLNGETDLAGQLFGYTQRSFTTGAGADLDPPAVAAVTPANGGTNLPVNTVIAIDVDEPVDALSVGANALRVLDGATPIAGTFTVAPNLRRISFAPALPLGAGVTFAIQASGFKDVAGNPVAAFASSFTTATSQGGNLAPTLGATESASSFYSTTYPPSAGVDGRLDTWWCTAYGEAANLGDSPYWEQLLPGDATVSQIRFFGRDPGYNFIAGRFELFSAAGAALFDSGQVNFAPPDRDAIVPTGGVAGVRRIRFTSLLDESQNPCFAEIEVVGSYVDPRLAQVLDTRGPTLVSTSPVNAATNVAVNSTISALFSEPLNPLALDATTFQVTVDGFSGILPGTLSAAGNGVTFTPLSPLPPNRIVRAYVTAPLEDLAGNDIPYTNWYFTTGATADATPPSVLSVTPMDGAADIGRTTPIVLIFSEPIDAATAIDDNFLVFANGAELTKTLSRSADNTTVTLSATWPADAELAVVVTNGVKDLAGNRLPDFESLFRTGSVEDVGRPTIVSQRPASGATRVAPARSIVFYASEALDAATVPGGIVVTQNGVRVTGTTEVSAGGTSIEFTPGAPLLRNALIQITLDASIADLEGNALNVFQSSYRTLPDPSTEAAIAESVNPRNGATAVPTNSVLEVRFSEPLSAASVNPSTVRLYPSGLPEASGTVALLEGGRLLRFTPSAALSPSRSYSWQITGVLSTDGGAVNFYSGFTTGAASDSSVPTVTSIAPPDGAVAVGVNARVVVRFSEAVSPLTVTGDNIALAGPDGVIQPCTISFADSDRTVLIEPHGPLAESAVHDIFVSGVRDVAGNLVTPESASFTTRAGADTAAPALARYAPPNGATAVPTNTQLRFTFNEPIDPGSVAPGTIQIYPSGQSVLAGVATVGSDGRSVVFVPAAPLAPSLYHSWYLSGIRDVSGNEIAYSGLSFTTGTGSDAAAPTVLRVSPADGALAAPTNVRIAIEMSEAVSAADLGGIVLRAGVTPIPVVASLSSTARIVYLQPLLPLAPNTLHEVTIDGVRDFAGNAIGSAVVSDFSTGTGADSTPGTVPTWTPGPAATGVSTATAITLQFSERVDPISVNTATFTLVDNGLGQYRAGTVVVAADRLSATFTPAAALRASAQHSWYLSGATDLAGQTFTYSSHYFTTGTGP